MFVVHEDMTIYATRGDVVYFSAEKKQGDAKYKFQPGDIVRMKIFCKKNCGKVMLVKDFLVEEETTSVNIFLGKGETKFGEIISKPVDYWYELELNPDTFPDTFVGYDENGAKLFKLFPEAKDVTEGEITDPDENSAVSRMVVTFVNEYLGENAKDLVNEAIDKYFAEHPTEDGEDGKDGTDGFSPIAKVTQTTSGAVITITDATGTSTATVKNGSDGKDGSDGTDGKDGRDGVDGEDGYTPVKYKDYFTEADKQEVVDAVLEQVPEHTETIKLVAEALPKVTALNFANFDNGSFMETVDGEAVTHSVVFDSKERPVLIDNIAITWEV